MASAVVDGWHGDLDAALAEYGRQRDQCAIPLSDANLGIARLDLAAGQLGAAWYQMNGLEQALENPAAVGDLPPYASRSQGQAAIGDRASAPRRLAALRVARYRAGHDTRLDGPG